MSGAATVELQVTGLSCASCVGRVETALKNMPQVGAVSINFATRIAQVEIDPRNADAAISVIETAGYGASVKISGEDVTLEDAAETPALLRATVTAFVLTIPLFAMEMGGHIFPAFHHWLHAKIGVAGSWGVQFILATVVLFWPGWRIVRPGVIGLFRGRADMNALVALGAGAAWGYSTLALFVPELFPAGARQIYFEAAAVSVSLILMGRLLEARARGRTGAAIRAVIGLQPKTGRVVVDGDVVEMRLEEIEVGALIELRPGERVAVDGVVETGRSYVDESMISGEPMPVEKSTGAGVIAGTLNGTGALRYCAQAVGEETVLAQIVATVAQAQAAKLPLQALVNRVTAWFVPAVLVIAVITCGVWVMFGPSLGHALVAAVSVLIIACPCAMGLATPTSIMVGTSRAAEMGVLFRKGDALQRLRDVDVVAFDKTGTLTVGRPEVSDFEVFDGFEENDVIAAVAALEVGSEHPIAGAFLRAAQTRALDLPVVTEFFTETGFGIRGHVAGVETSVGTARMMQAHGVELGQSRARAAGMAERGQTVVYCAIDGRIAGLFAISDPIKDSARDVLADLKARGLKIAMITGDGEVTAAVIAGQLGIDDVIADVRPEGKLKAIEGLRRDGARVAFVGDGINDAPALAGADVGVAIGTGTDVAIEAADVVLMSGELAGVTNAVVISTAVMRNIRQNLIWAFGYNILLIPVAAGVLFPFTGLLLSPALAAGAMALSSVFVLSNALRLKRVHSVGHRGAA
jgi:Cu+-exporting ATPase